MLKKFIKTAFESRIGTGGLKAYFSIQIPEKNQFQFDKKEVEILTEELKKPPIVFYSKLGITSLALISTLPFTPFSNTYALSIALFGGLSILFDRRITTTLKDMRLDLKVEKSEMHNNTNQ